MERVRNKGQKKMSMETEKLVASESSSGKASGKIFIQC